MIHFSTGQLRLLLLTLWPWIGLCSGFADPWKNANDLLRLTSSVPLADDNRMDLNRRAVAKAAARYGRSDLVKDILSSGTHYNTPQSYVEAILSGWPSCTRENLYQWTSDAIEKLPLAMGYQIEEIQSRLIKITLVGQFVDLHRKIQSSNYPNLPPTAKSDIVAFESTLHPSIMDWFYRLFNRRNYWLELQKKPTAEDVKFWRESRVFDGFSSNLLLSEALRRTTSGNGYPSDWISYASKSLNAGYYNSTPLLNGVLLYRLAVQGKKNDEALAALSLVEKFSLLTPAVSFETYGTLLDLAKSCDQERIYVKNIEVVIENKLSQAKAGLNSYEKMLVYPQIAAAFVALGSSAKAIPLREEALAFIEKDIDPETKGVGLTRLWLSYAVAGDEPEKKVLSRMDEQARRIGMEIKLR